MPYKAGLVGIVATIGVTAAFATHSVIHLGKSKLLKKSAPPVESASDKGGEA